MQYLFLIILIGALGVGLVVLASLGLTQRRRRRRLARAAHEMGLKFSPDDPFDLARRYRDFVLTSAGHSRRAANVVHGQYQGWSLRAFDFSFEVGHGPSRRARRYSVLAAGARGELPPALLWHAADNEYPPLAVRRQQGRLGVWRVIHGWAFAPQLAEALADFAEEPLSAQTLGGCVILCSPARWHPRTLAQRIARTVAALESLRPRRGGR